MVITPSSRSIALHFNPSTSFDFCGVSDLSPLVGLPNLERLRVTRNTVSDFSVLRSNPNLKYLRWKSDDESSTASDTLSELTQLRTLFIGGKAIKNLEFLRGMTSLIKLSLFMCNDSCDCTMLKEINNLFLVTYCNASIVILHIAYTIDFRICACYYINSITKNKYSLLVGPSGAICSVTSRL